MHNYEKKLMQLYRQGKVPQLSGKQYSAKICHDSWCQVYLGKECNCDPDIVCTEITNQNRAEIAAEIAKSTSEIQFITRTDSRWKARRHRRSKPRG
jgi:hypothetical protein